MSFFKFHLQTKMEESLLMKNLSLGKEPFILAFVQSIQGVKEEKTLLLKISFSSESRPRFHLPVHLAGVSTRRTPVVHPEMQTETGG